MQLTTISRPKRGEDVNGDAYHIERLENGNKEEKLLVAVVDGLGHGKYACLASKTAVDFIKAHKHLALKEMVMGVHKALIGTRGAVIGMSAICNGTLSYIGVGNISAQIVHNAEQQQHLTSTSGVLGWNLRTLKVFHYAYQSGWLVMNSDGIRRFSSSEYLSDDLDAMASNILKNNERDDDATVVIVKR